MQSEKIRTLDTSKHISFLCISVDMTLFEFAKGLGLCHCVGVHFYLLLLDMIDMRALCVETFFKKMSGFYRTTHGDSFRCHNEKCISVV